jgi:hypothetical protein
MQPVLIMFLSIHVLIIKKQNKKIFKKILSNKKKFFINKITNTKNVYGRTNIPDGFKVKAKHVEIKNKFISGCLFLASINNIKPSIITI